MEWYDNYESTITIQEKVWQVVQTVPKNKQVFAQQITDQVNKDKDFTTTKSRRIREALQELLIQKKIRFVCEKNINGNKVKLFERV
jgi:hypothetical protein